MTVGEEFGSLLAGLPAYVNDPPIEAVCFAFGVSEDGQLVRALQSFISGGLVAFNNNFIKFRYLQGLDATGNVLAPKVLEALLGTRLRGLAFGRTPLVAGSRCSVAISADGDVYTWGWNSRASLGQGHRDHVPKPRRVAGLCGVPIVQVALGGWHTLLLDNEGQVWACGGDEYMQSGQAAKERDVLVPTMCLPALRVCQVSAGGMHSLALTEDGNLWTWGEPWGSFSMTIDRRPHRVEVEDPEEILDRGGFVAIACGAFHNLALTATGEIYSFGLNDYGQLGLGHTASVTAPQRIVDGLEGVTVAHISCGGWHSACVSTRGEVFMWGRGEYGRLGLGDKSGSSKLRPAKIWALEKGVKMVQVSCGGSHTLGVTADGKAWSWGRGSFGRLGTGEERDAISPVELKLPGGPERWHVIAVAAGGRHSLCFAVPDNGNLLMEQRRQRSPMGLSPQSSGIRLNSAAIAAAAAAAAAADRGGRGGEDLETDGGGADDELSTSPDGDSPISSGDGESGGGGDEQTLQREYNVEQIDINIPPPIQNNHQVHHPQRHQHAVQEVDSDREFTNTLNNRNDENEVDDDGLNSLEELIAQAPSVVPTNSTTLSATATAFSPAGDLGMDRLGRTIPLISQGVASLNLQNRELQQHESENVAVAEHHQAPYVELSPSKQRVRYYRGTGGGMKGRGRSQSPRRDVETIQVNKTEAEEEEDDDEEYGVVEPSEQESDSEPGAIGREAKRAASSAAATMHGLRDDVLGDKF